MQIHKYTKFVILGCVRGSENKSNKQRKKTTTANLINFIFGYDENQKF